ncbi:hypothetical protein [Arthrobacter sp. NicSoilB11]|uniref:hypothetical protein n=1 Tax=Arthrobacter sp. NicSoilB11 TaxID=2830999 RepID=UPI001CC41454|nr:hypothetical protein [Arthrobacter sp. NicSoilB11]BCW76262.1 hypothetical protein NicSoilB11_25870 [Arthrobacter sp. NicSoilB11]
MTTPPFLKPRFWEWKDQNGTGTRGVGLFRGADLKAHLTPAQARTLADKLHDMADRIESKETP